MSTTRSMKKLTISVSSEFYEGLLLTAGSRNLGAFIEQNLTPRVAAQSSLEAGYQAMAADERYNREASEWTAMSGETLPKETW